MTVTWNPADLSGVTLSGGNLIATDSGGTTADGVRSTTSQTTGKVAFSVAAAGTSFSANGCLIGVSKSGASYTGGDANSFVLLYAPGAGYFISSSGTVVAGPDNTSTAPNGSTDVVTVLLDSSGLLYFQCNGNNLFGANPASGTGGLSIATAAWFADFGAGSLVSAGTTAGTANFSPTGLPSGFSGLDGSSGLTISPAAAHLSLSGATPSIVNTSPAWSIVGISEAAINASGNYTLTEPAGCQQNDVLVVFLGIRSTVIYTDVDWSFDQSDSGGNTTNNTTASDTSFQAGHVFRGASAPSLVFARTGGSRAFGTILAYRSNQAGTPSFDTSAKVAATVASATVTNAGVTTAQDLELLVAGLFLSRGSATTNQASNVHATNPSGASGAINTTANPVVGTWTERSDRGNTTSPTVALACYDSVRQTAGATGNVIATAANSALNGMVVLAFQHPVASGVTLSPPAGALTLSGSTPSAAATANQSMSPAAASLLLAVSSPAIVVSVALQPVAAALSLSGATPGLSTSANVALQPTTGNLALSGAIPSVTATANLAIGPAPASLLLSGVTPGVGQGASIFLQPGAGALVLSGSSPAVSVSANVAASPAGATLSLSGASPAAAATANQAIAPGAAALQLAGSAPSVVQGGSIALLPAPAALALAAAAPAVARSTNVVAAPAAAALQLSGDVPTIVQGASISLLPGATALLLAAGTPSVAASADVVLAPGAAALHMAAATPSVQAGGSASLSPAAAHLALSGAGPSVDVSADVVLTPSAAALSLSGQSPRLAVSLTLAPAAGALSLVCGAPAVRIAISVSPAAASLTLATMSPSCVQDNVRQPGAASLVLGGVAPRVVQDNSKRPAAAQLMLSAAQPGLVGTQNILMVIGQASLALTVNAPGIFISSGQALRRLTAQGVALDITGLPAGSPAASIPSTSPSFSETGAELRKLDKSGVFSEAAAAPVGSTQAFVPSTSPGYNDNPGTIYRRITTKGVSNG